MPRNLPARTLPTLRPVRASLAAKFKASLGESLIQYRISYRLLQAGRLLAQTTSPVGQIAEQVGFNEQPYFSRAFRKKFGRSPLAYRQTKQRQFRGVPD